jgi:hypothetical protein
VLNGMPLLSRLLSGSGRREFAAEVSWDLLSLAAGATVLLDVTVTGARVGDLAQASLARYRPRAGAQRIEHYHRPCCGDAVGTGDEAGGTVTGAPDSETLRRATGLPSGEASADKADARAARRRDAFARHRCDGRCRAGTGRRARPADPCSPSTGGAGRCRRVRIGIETNGRAGEAELRHQVVGQAFGLCAAIEHGRNGMCGIG